MLVRSGPVKRVRYIQLWTSVGTAANHVGVPVAKSDAIALTTAAGSVMARFLSDVGSALTRAKVAERLGAIR